MPIIFWAVFTTLWSTALSAEEDPYQDVMQYAKMLSREQW